MKRPRKAAARGNGARPWSVRSAWAKAWKVMQDTCPAEVLPPEPGVPIRLSSNPVEQARQLAEIATVADMKMSLLLTHGTDPETLERYRGAFNLIAGSGLAVRRLAIAGLKSGDSAFPETDHKLAEALERWNASRAGRGLPAESEPDER